MKKFLISLCVFSLLIPPSVLAEDRSILLVTSAGVYKADVVNGVPGPFAPVNYDVIIQGIGAPVPPTDPPPTDPPQPGDPIVQQIAAISRQTLADVKEATAVASIIDSLSKFGLTGTKFKEALELAAPIADTSMKAEGRINAWVKAALAVSIDAAKLKAGVTSAFNISASTLNVIHDAAMAGPNAAIPQEALDWAMIIQIIQMIFELLRNLGII